MKEISDLLDLLNLEQIEENLFRGYSKTVGSPNVFGGQVMAQSLSAAMNTVEFGRNVHSLHCYFILPGNLDLPIVFQVDRIRDGGSFTTRRVKAIQQGREIFLLSASFQTDEPGLDHQTAMPQVASPESLVSWKDLAKHFGEHLPKNMYAFLNLDRPIEFRPVELYHPDDAEKREPFRHIWMKSIGNMPDQRRQHDLALAYASDYNLLTSALLPHGKEGSISRLQLASLDHAMWFHRSFRMDDWLLYAIDSPSASNGRGFTRGNIYTRDGVLVASVAQEGLMRQRREKN